MDIGPLSGPFGRPDPSLPQVFGRYLLVQRLSRGGMGEIFLAKHGLEGFEKLAVIKKVLPHLAADEQFISRFVDEAQVAIKLSHVNVAQVFEVGRVGDEYFLALEYIDGRDLRRTMGLLGHRRQRLPVDLALFIARELANGLAYAHRRTTSDGASLNLVHCDISPPNVLVSFEGETKVIDFGIAKSVMRETASDPKLGFGKFGYMAPEQLIRGGVVDYRTDLYAAGVVLYEVLTNSRLYESGREPDYRALAKKVSRGEHPLPSDIDRSLAPYDDLVATALRPKAEDRYQSAAELRDAIQQCLVAVNPTISTDQLGAYMRDLFADEMAAQRELHERVASAHLSDFQEQFHTQTISTVSFALAQAPDATGRVWRMSSGQARARARSADGSEVVKPRQHTPAPGHAQVKPLPTPVPGHLLAKPSPQIKPSPAFDTMAPPTSAMDRLAIDDLEPAAPTIVRRGRFQDDRRRRALIIGLIGAIVIVLGFVAGRLAGGRSERPRRRLVATSRDQHAIVVEPIPVDPPQADHVDPEDIEMTPDDPGDPTKPHVPGGVRPGHRVTPRRDPRTPAPPPVPAVAPFSHEQLSQKFQQVRHEYDDYKAKYGSRLEKEWGELATFIQYLPASEDDTGRKEAARRLDVFRSRMRE
jgi:serine/threonine protein kinase